MKYRATAPRLARMAAAGLALLLAPLAAFADKTYFVATTGTDDLVGTRGTVVGNPWATLAFAMANMRQAGGSSGANGHSILQVANGTYTTSISFNPVNRPANGYRYFIYGNLGDSNSVIIGASGGTQTKVCSTYVSIKGFWFKGGLNINPGFTFSQGYAFSRSGYFDQSIPDTSRYWRTNRRLFDSVAVCRIGVDQTGNGLTIYGSNVTLFNCHIHSWWAIGRHNGGSTGGTSTCTSCACGGPSDNLRRQRIVNVHLYNITSLMKNNPTTGLPYKDSHVWMFGITADSTGCEAARGPYHDARLSVYLDSLRIWYCNMSATIDGTTSNYMMLGMYHCVNASLRGNHWSFDHSSDNTGAGMRPYTFRDSIDNLHIDCDTVIVKDNPLGSPSPRMYIGYNHWKSGYGRCYWVVDSSYFQFPDFEWHGDVMAGRWSYTSFVSLRPMIMNSNVNRPDSLQTTTFDHCTFIGTGTTGALVALDGVDVSGKRGTGWSWPAVGPGSLPANQGNVFRIKNCLFYRPLKGTDPTSEVSSSTMPLLGFPYMASGAPGGGGIRNCAAKVDLNNNAFITYNKLTTAGDLSYYWRTSSNGYKFSRPRYPYPFKAMADAAWIAAGNTVGSEARRYDWSGLPGPTQGGKPIDARLHAYLSSASSGDQGYPTDTTFAGIWTTGRQLDLRPGFPSILREAADDGSDIGAAAGYRGICTFLSDTSFVVKDNDSGVGVMTATVTVKNTGESPLIGVWDTQLGNGSGSGHGGYAVLADSSVYLAPGKQRNYLLTVLSPSVDPSDGAYTIRAVISTNESAGHPARAVKLAVLKNLDEVPP